MSSPDVDVYRALGQTFAALGLRWYLFGAQAAILHGAVRFTEDVDVTVDLGARSPHDLIQAFRQRGFTPRISDDDFIERTRVIPLVHIETETPVDVVLSGPGIEELFFDGIVEIPVEDLRVPVAGAADVVVMKILAGRAKDQEDVVSVLAAQGDRFATERARQLLQLLEQALDQSDLLPAFEAALLKAARVRR